MMWQLADLLSLLYTFETLQHWSSAASCPYIYCTHDKAMLSRSLPCTLRFIQNLMFSCHVLFTGSGKYGPGTMSAIRHMQQLQAQLGLADAASPSNEHAPHSSSDSSSTTMRGAAAGACTGSTAAQRYWSNPDNSASGTPLTPLLKSWYAGEVHLWQNCW